MKTCTPRRNKAPLVLLAALMLTLSIGISSAQEGDVEGNTGTIKVHDNEEADPDQRNEPHVDCDFWIEGFNMSDDSGSLVFFSWPPTGDKSEVFNDTWTGTPEEDGRGFHFLSGPYELTSGHYRVEASTDDGHPGGNDHFAKAKMFWVVCGEDDGERVPDECPPTSLSATALPDGDVLLTFEAPENATGMNIYRAEGGGDFEYIMTTGPEVMEYLDTDTVVGTTYTYTVHPLFGNVEAEDCEQVTVTAIPVFTGALVTGLAAALGIGAYAVAARRR